MVPEEGLEPSVDLLTLLEVLQTSSPPGLFSGSAGANGGTRTPTNEDQALNLARLPISATLASGIALENGRSSRARTGVFPG